MVTNKTKETKALIKGLADNLSAVRPVVSPAKRMFVWGLFSIVIIVAIATIQIGFRHDADTKVNDLSFIAENIAMFLIGFGALFSAFKFAIPDINRDREAVTIVITGVFFWLSMLAMTFLTSDTTNFENIFSFNSVSHCITDLLMVTTIPIIALFALIRKSAPVFPLWAGYTVLLAISSIGALVMRYVCPVDESSHLFLTHFFPAFSMSFLGLLIGRLFLRW